MKILFLSKRRPQGKDLYERSSGRFYHFPKILAKRGHTIEVLLLSYNREPKISAEKNGIKWTALSLLSHGPIAYLHQAKKIINNLNPDWIVGFSDTYYGILAQRLGKKHHISSLIDAYDNYESYLPWCKPLHLMWRRAIRDATSITAAGPQLASLLQSCRLGQDVNLVPMAADPEFVPLDITKARQQLGLSFDKKLIGYCGAIYNNRGIELLFELAERVQNEIPNAELVLTGRKEKTVDLPTNIKYLGYLSDNQMPLVINSMNVLLVLSQDTMFGKYSYPAKLYEAMQCNVPVVASDTDSIRWILNDDRRFLANIGDVEDFINKIFGCLRLGKHKYPTSQSWENITDGFEEHLKRAQLYKS